jgi:hypothetical protein
MDFIRREAGNQIMGYIARMARNRSMVFRRGLAGTVSTDNN